MLFIVGIAHLLLYLFTKPEWLIISVSPNDELSLDTSLNVADYVTQTVLKALPLSLLCCEVISIACSFVFSRKITVPIKQIGAVTEQMARMEKDAAAPLQKLQALMSSIIWVIALVSAVILSLILNMWGRSRIYETGVLLSLGIGKMKIIGQHLAEVLMVAVIALGCSYFTSSAFAGQLAFERMAGQLYSGTECESSFDTLYHIAIGYRRFARENPELYKTIVKIPSTGGSDLIEKGQNLVHRLYPVLEACGLSEKDIIHFSRTIRSAMHGFITLEEAGFLGTMVDADESYSYMVETLIRSLKNEYGGEDR